MSALGLIFCLMAVVGVGLLWWGLHGRRVGGHPYCRRCGFDLFGSPEPRERCGECGAELSGGRAVVVGERQRRWGLAGMGAALLLVVMLAGGGAVVGAARGVQWYWYAPHWWVAGDMGSKDWWRARVGFDEALRRLQVGKLTRAEARPLVDRLLAMHGDAAIKPRNNRAIEVQGEEVTQALGAALAADLLDQRQLAVYEQNVMKFAEVRADMAEERRVGMPIEVMLWMLGRRLAPGTGYTLELRAQDEATFDGRDLRGGRSSTHNLTIDARRSNGLRAQFWLEPPGWTEHAMGPVVWKLKGELRLVRADGSVAGSRPVDMEQTGAWTEGWGVKLFRPPWDDPNGQVARKEVLETLATGQLRLVAEGSDAVNGPAQAQWWLYTSLSSMAMSGDLYLRSGGEELHVGRFLDRGSHNAFTSRVPVTPPSGGEEEMVFRASPLMAAMAGDIRHVWMGMVRARTTVIRGNASAANNSTTVGNATADDGKLAVADALELGRLIGGKDTTARNDAVWEVTRRLWEMELAGTRGAAEHPLRELVDALMDVQGDAAVRWNPQVGDALDLLLLQGAMGGAQERRYLSQAAAGDVFVLWAPGPATLGRDLQLEATYVGPRLGRVIARKFEIDMWAVAGQERRRLIYHRVKPEVNPVSHHFSMSLGRQDEGGGSLLNQQSLNAREIEFELVCRSFGMGGAPLGESTVRFKRRFERAEKEAVERVRDDATRQELMKLLRPREIRVREIQGPGGERLVELMPVVNGKEVRLPVDVAMEMQFVLPTANNALVTYTNESITQGGVLIKYGVVWVEKKNWEEAGGADVGAATVRMRTMKPMVPVLNRVFDGELEFRDVPLVRVGK